MLEVVAIIAVWLVARILLGELARIIGERLVRRRYGDVVFLAMPSEDVPRVGSLWSDYLGGTYRITRREAAPFHGWIRVRGHKIG